MWQPLKTGLMQSYALFDRGCGAAVAAYTAGGGRIFCRRGCRNCCNLAVRCTLGEALLVAETLPPDFDAALEDYVGRARRELGAADGLTAFLRLHRRLVGLCPFLDAEGACAVYPERPFACRSLLSTRPAEWCAVDVSELHPLEKQAYLSSLDPSVVNWPTHHLAAPRDLAREFESESAWRMREAFGFSLCGDLPVLVWLERRHGLSAKATEGFEAVADLLAQHGLDLPFLLQLER